MDQPHPDVDDSLLRRAVEGKPGAQAELWGQYRSRLKRMVAIRLDHRIANRVDASDIVQETLTQAFQRLPKYIEDQRIPFYPWLRRIACDRLGDAYRVHVLADKRSVLSEQHEYLPVNDDSLVNLAANIAAVCHDPHQQHVQAEEIARVQAAINQLRPTDREILVLRYLERLSVPELAAALEIKVSAVTSRHLRAIERLRAVLAKDASD